METIIFSAFSPAQAGYGSGLAEGPRHAYHVTRPIGTDDHRGGLNIVNLTEDGRSRNWT
jgi:hypothetical protein